jgi:hypothetical protein
MNLARRIAATLILFAGLGCASTPSTPTAEEVVSSLRIGAWRVPEPPSGSEWSLEVVTELPPVDAGLLASGPALVSFRPTGNDDYEFVLKQLGAQSSGTIKPCSEPEGVPSICDGYSLEFEMTPRCVGDCSKAVLARIAAMLNPADRRWLILVAQRSLRIEPGDRTIVIPIP